jgi:hypothetical protein
MAVPGREVEAIAKQADVIIVPEMNMGQIVGEVERYACGEAEGSSLEPL